MNCLPIDKAKYRRELDSYQLRSEKHFAISPKHKGASRFVTPQNIIRVMKSGTSRSAGQVARMGLRSAYTVLAGKPERRRSRGRPRRSWEGNIKINLKEVE